MESTKVVFTGHARGEIELHSDGKKAGEMQIAVTHGKLTVYHTGVYDQFKDRGFAKILLEKLVSYARENDFKIVPLCPYVLAQFTRHPEAYSDVWFQGA